LRRATVLASGNGSNFEAVVTASREGSVPLEVTALIANRAQAGVLERARRLGVRAEVVAWERPAESRVAYDARLTEAVAATQPELILLLGWMHVLPPSFIERFPEALNLHPAFLPLDPRANVVRFPDGSEGAAFRGAHALDDALQAHSDWIGASVHRVGVSVDRGDVLARAPLRIGHEESRDALERRLHALEHEVLGEAIRLWVASKA
jgi:folate-dependent phosphoribosylglycinamide formyltransferase PurN